MKKTEKLADYIVRLYKSLNKSLEDAIEVVVWYTMTDTEQEEVEEKIKQIW